MIEIVPDVDPLMIGMPACAAALDRDGNRVQALVDHGLFEDLGLHILERI